MCLLLLAFIYADNTDWDESWFRTPTRYNISSLLEGGTDDFVTPDKKGKTAKNADAAEGDGSAKVSKTAKVTKGDNEEDDYLDEAKTKAGSEGDGSPMASKTAKVAKDDEEEDIYPDRTNTKRG